MAREARADPATLRPFAADYQGSVEGVGGVGRLSLEKAGHDGRWLIGMRVQSQSAVAEVSTQTVFDVQGMWLRPLSHNYQKRILLFNSQVDADFDWSRMEARWSGDIASNHKAPVGLQEGDTEPLLVHLAVVMDLAVGRPTTYRDLENGRARTAQYQREAEELVTFNGQTHKALRLSNQDGKTKYTIWVVPGIPCPVRLMQQDKGELSIDLRFQEWAWQ